MSDPRINLKDTWTAAALGFLVPGAGHLYQGRYFKAVLYAVCIGGLYLSGLQMSHGQIVNSPTFSEQPQNRGQMLKFAAQAGVGLPAVIAVVQSKRYHSADNRELRRLDAPLIAPFEGRLAMHAQGGSEAVTGTIELKPAEGQFGEVTEGRFVGRTAAGEPVDYALGEFIEIERPISNSPGRNVQAEIHELRDGRPQQTGGLSGTIPRAWTDRVLVPLSADQERGLHRRLGKFHELATVFTMIAGLLNILAAWDAFAGPAYGYGDPPEPAADPDDAASPAEAAGHNPAAAATIDTTPL